MSVVPKYSLNVPLQLLLHQQPKILSSKYHLIAHWSPWWLIPELHSRKGTKYCLNVPLQLLLHQQPESHSYKQLLFEKTLQGRQKTDLNAISLLKHYR